MQLYIMLNSSNQSISIHLDFTEKERDNNAITQK